jgi:hypothetical protein
MNDRTIWALYVVGCAFLILILPDIWARDWAHASRSVGIAALVAMFFAWVTQLLDKVARCTRP